MARFAPISRLVLAAFVAAGAPPMAAAQEDEEEDQQEQQEQQDQQDQQDDRSRDGARERSRKRGAKPAPGKTGAAAAARGRSFEDALSEVLDAFQADARTGPLRAARRVAVRRVQTSATLSRSHGRYLDAALAERLGAVTKGRLVDCVPCRARTSALVEGKLLLAAPGANVEQLDQAAEKLGVQYWVDFVFVFNRASIALAVQVVDAKSKALAWSRTYDGATLTARRERLAALDRAISASRGRESYVPELNVAFTVGGAGIPNVGGGAEDSMMVAAALRVTESFDAKTDEVGLVVTLYRSTSSTVSEYPAEKPAAGDEPPPPKEKVLKPIPRPFDQAYGVTAIYGLLLAGDPEHFDAPRYGVHGGLGVLAATGYLAPAARLGVDAHYGKRILVTGAAHYFAPTSVKVGDARQQTTGGVGGELTFGLRF